MLIRMKSERLRTALGRTGETVEVVARNGLVRFHGEPVEAVVLVRHIDSMAEVIEEGRATIKAAGILDVIRPKSMDGTDVLISSERGVMIDSQSFPSIVCTAPLGYDPPTDSAGRTVVLGIDLNEALGVAVKHTRNLASSPLSDIHVKLEQQWVFIEATDGHSLLQLSRGEPENNDGIVVPVEWARKVRQWTRLRAWQASALHKVTWRGRPGVAATLVSSDAETTVYGIERRGDLAYADTGNLPERGKMVEVEVIADEFREALSGITPFTTSCNNCVLIRATESRGLEVAVTELDKRTRAVVNVPAHIYGDSAQISMDSTLLHRASLGITGKMTLRLPENPRDRVAEIGGEFGGMKVWALVMGLHDWN